MLQCWYKIIIIICYCVKKKKTRSLQVANEIATFTEQIAIVNTIAKDLK